MLVSKCCKSELELIETVYDNYFECYKCGIPCDTMFVTSFARESSYDPGYEIKTQAFTDCA